MNRSCGNEIRKSSTKTFTEGDGGVAKDVFKIYPQICFLNGSF